MEPVTVCCDHNAFIHVHVIQVFPDVFLRRRLRYPSGNGFRSNCRGLEERQQFSQVVNFARNASRHFHDKVFSGVFLQLPAIHGCEAKQLLRHGVNSGCV
ncbi:hypothetical protein D3C87_1688010 [compost metagenome]